MDGTILQNEFFTNILLPFILVFAIVYAILDKTEILGTDKRGPNGLISLAISLIFVGVPAATGLTTKLIPIVSIFIVIIFSLLLVLGFIRGFGQEEGKPLFTKAFMGWMTGLLITAFIIAIAWSTGLFEKVKATSLNVSSQFWQGLIFVILIIAVIAITIGKKPTEEELQKRLEEVKKRKAGQQRSN